MYAVGIIKKHSFFCPLRSSEGIQAGNVHEGDKTNTERTERDSERADLQRGEALRLAKTNPAARVMSAVYVSKEHGCQIYFSYSLVMFRLQNSPVKVKKRSVSG